MSSKRSSAPKKKKSSTKRPDGQFNLEASSDRQSGRRTRYMAETAASERTVSHAPQSPLDLMPTDASPRPNTQQLPYRSHMTYASAAQERTRVFRPDHRQSKLQNLERQLSESSEHIKELQEELRRYRETASRNVSSLKAKIQSLECQLSESSANIKLLEEDVRKKDEETKMLASRLSEMASKNVLSSNVGLEDLSTQNRSMKIAEEFEQDLYGSVWFLALESLLEINDKLGEDVCTRLLFRILMSIYEEKPLELHDKLFSMMASCKCNLVVYQKCKDQLHRAIVSANSFISPSFDPNPTSSSSMARSGGTNTEKAEREIRRLFASYMSLESTEIITERDMDDILTESVKATELPAKNWRMSSQSVTNFVEVSSKICRMMLVQDPPMVLISGANEDGSFNPNMFSCYGRKGKRVDFVVWPALALYDGGPVMSKGTIKCK